MTLPPPVTTPATVVLAQSGDTAAREELARECQRIAWRYALRFTGDPDAAMDVAQDAMLRFFGSLQRFRAERPLRPWLLQIVRNLARDNARRSRTRPTGPLHADSSGMVLEPADAADGPEERAASGELQRLVWRCLGELSNEHREIVILRDFEDLSYREIAQVLHCPRGTVMSRLHRARRALAELLRARCGAVGGDDD